jgi:hypothetical protein
VVSKIDKNYKFGRTNPISDQSDVSWTAPQNLAERTQFDCKLRHAFRPANVPERDLEPKALAFHKEVSEEQVRVLYRGTGKTGGYRA